MSVERGPQEGAENYLSTYTPDKLVALSAEYEGLVPAGLVVATIGMGLIGAALAGEPRAEANHTINGVAILVGGGFFALGVELIKGGVEGTKSIANEFRRRGLEVTGTPGIIIRYKDPIKNQASC